MPVHSGISPLDGWLAQCCGGPEHLPLPERVAQFQLQALRASLQWCCRHSQHYRARIGENPSALHSLKDIALLPFTTAADVYQWQRMLCVSQGDVARMVTLQTSGTTGPPKRLAFSLKDLQRTREFFRVGMGPLVQAGQRVVVLLPGGERPHGVADLLRQSLPDVDVYAASCSSTPQAARALLEQHAPHALVAAPAQLGCLLAAFGHDSAPPLAGGILSSGEPLPCDLQQELARTFSCLVLDHYGLTESGYGCGVQCPAHDGYHLREADVLLEVVDIHDGSPLPDGHMGEVVITTLGREAMPLIRYRTGDAAAIVAGPCACGSPLRRLGNIQGRLMRQENRVYVQQLPKGAQHDTVSVHTL